ncbi:related to triacylglycerol lipase II precursor [Cephalotrichum gorgonifer]|uniref:Carboxylic ester hydrolase n=1 Tax=Cephalotrichum gorgonifer TaxID=2041049 RepID=A0AAE8SUF7_9PEZI|nr:related to triacylglycerol lipase II precursor [Cephalotrichum gorgonifer]
MLLLILLLYFLYAKQYQGPKVSLDYATYKGTKVGNGVDQYLGMRYAAPPVGDLRWRAPRDPPKVKGVQKAQRWGPICYGMNHGLPGHEDEDCLHVNVWAPSGANEKSKLPVWVYIQGGGYTANSNHDYKGTSAIEESGGNLVFVNFNYRVGLWGFLADERVREDGDLNVGLLDQRHLLRWVKKHISKFGGDPDHVVIHGVSAGAGSVALHLAAYGGRDDNLFVGAVAQSIFFPAHPRVDELRYQFNATLDRLGCEDADNPMACLRGLSKESLQQEGNQGQPFPGRSSGSRWYWTPCVDGDIMEDTPSAMFGSGKFITVPVMLGTTTDEGSIFSANAASSEAFTSFMQDNYPGLSDDDVEAMLKYYPKEEPVPRHLSWFPTTSRAYGEATFICPANLVLDSFDAAGSPDRAWSYRYNVWDADQQASGRGVEHTFDRAAIHGPDCTPGSPRSYSSYNAPMVPLMMNYYISFVRALDPNVHRLDGAPEWGTWKGGSRLRLELNASKMEVTDKGQRERCAFWGGLAGRMEN